MEIRYVFLPLILLANVSATTSVVAEKVNLPGSACRHVYTEEVVNTVNFGIYKQTLLDATDVVCPVSKTDFDTTTHRGGIESAWVRIRELSPVFSPWCTLYAKSIEGEVYYYETIVLSERSGSADASVVQYSGGSIRALGANEGMYIIDCALPRNTAVISYQVNQ